MLRTRPRGIHGKLPDGLPRVFDKRLDFECALKDRMIERYLGKRIKEGFGGRRMGKLRTSKQVYIFLCYLGSVMLGMQIAGYQSILYNVAEEFAMSATGQGMLAAVQYTSGLLIPLLFGGVADRFRKRDVLCVSAGVYAVGCLVAMVSTNAVLFCVAVFIVGAGFSMMAALFPATIVETDPLHGARNNSLQNVSFSIGAVVSPLFMSALMKGGAGWRTLYIIIGISALAVIALLLAMRVEPVNITDKREGKGGMKLLLCLVGASMATILLSCGSMENGIVGFFKNFFAAELGHEVFGGLAVSVFWIAMIPSRLLCGYFKNQRLLVKLCLAGAALSCLALGLCKNSALALGLVGLIGFFQGPVYPAINTMAMQSSPENMGLISSLLLVSSNLGGILMNFAMGPVSGGLGIGGGFCFAAGVSALAFAVYLFFGRKKKAA